MSGVRVPAGETFGTAHAALCRRPTPPRFILGSEPDVSPPCLVCLTASYLSHAPRTWAAGRRTTRTARESHDTHRSGRLEATSVAQGTRRLIRRHSAHEPAPRTERTTSRALRVPPVTAYQVVPPRGAGAKAYSLVSVRARRRWPGRGTMPASGAGPAPTPRRAAESGPACPPS